MTGMTEIRPYRLSDAEPLASLYRQSVRGLGPEQVAAWSAQPEDIEAFRALLAEGVTLVSTVDGQPVAFGQLNPPDHIAFVYTLPDHIRQGHAARIYGELEVQAVAGCCSRVGAPQHGRQPAVATVLRGPGVSCRGTATR